MDYELLSDWARRANDALQAACDEVELLADGQSHKEIAKVKLKDAQDLVREYAALEIGQTGVNGSKVGVDDWYKDGQK